MTAPTNLSQNVQPLDEAVPWLAAFATARRDAWPAGPDVNNDAVPALCLLHAHLAHAGVARREAAAFALALTQPEAAAAVRGFLARKAK